MSTTTALGITPNRRPVELAQFRNGHGWLPSIWKRLVAERYGFTGYLFGTEGDGILDRLCREIEDLPEWQQAPLVLTFDVGVIPWQEYEWAADQLDEFDRRLPAPEGHANHVPAMSTLLRSKPDAPFFGVWGTSVTENPFDPWDEEADEPGTGLPLFDADGRPCMYLLERHRSLVDA